MTFSSWQNKVTDNEAYKSHMEFGTYRGDKGRLTELIRLVGYNDKFHAACRGYLERTSWYRCGGTKTACELRAPLIGRRTREPINCFSRAG
jgi:hypothetical protein